MTDPLGLTGKLGIWAEVSSIWLLTEGSLAPFHVDRQTLKRLERQTQPSGLMGIYYRDVDRGQGAGGYPFRQWTYI